LASSTVEECIPAIGINKHARWNEGNVIVSNVMGILMMGANQFNEPIRELGHRVIDKLNKSKMQPCFQTYLAIWTERIWQITSLAQFVEADLPIFFGPLLA
jgi:hypothetical protein